MRVFLGGIYGISEWNWHGERRPMAVRHACKASQFAGMVLEFNGPRTTDPLGFTLIHPSIDSWR